MRSESNSPVGCKRCSCSSRPGWLVKVFVGVVTLHKEGRKINHLALSRTIFFCGYLKEDDKDSEYIKEWKEEREEQENALNAGEEDV